MILWVDKKMRKMHCPFCGEKIPVNEVCEECEKTIPGEFIKYYYRNFMSRMFKPGYSGEKKFCPSCQGDMPAGDFCTVCGHDLKDVIGYFPGLVKRTSPDIEVTKKNIIVYLKEEDNDDVNSFSRYKYIYPLSDIRNLKITRCEVKRIIKHKKEKTRPCMIFKYNNTDIEVKITTNKQIEGLEDIFSTELFQEAVAE
jgi:hypothetical protein